MKKALDITDKSISYYSIDDKTILLFIDMVRVGFSYNVFLKLAKNTPFSMSEWSMYLNMSERTMQRHKTKKKSFDPIFSEKILLIALLYNLGIEVFGDKKKFDLWLETQNVSLGGIIPKELLDSSFGIELLKDELIRIEHGILA